MLKAYGVRYILGVPGDTSLAFYDALCQAQAQITYVLTRDERYAQRCSIAGYFSICAMRA